MRRARVRLAVVAVALLFGAASRADAQEVVARFRIEEVRDTTFTFTIGKQRWVRPGRRGQAVDPARNDEFVAEFRVLQVAGETAEAVITGQTRRLLPEHVAIMLPPERPFWRQALFWVGMVGGAVLGFAAGTAM